MILDSTNQFIFHILENCELKDKIILEIGCGSGRITKELIKHAGKVIAIDNDGSKLNIARRKIISKNVRFVHCGAEQIINNFEEKSFDIVIFSLSFHHISIDSMFSCLFMAESVLKDEGLILIIEPGLKGSFIQTEERFNLGDGNERKAKITAKEYIFSNRTLKIMKEINFKTLFCFEDLNDFLRYFNIEYNEKIEYFLNNYSKNNKIVLDAERVMYVLRKKSIQKYYNSS